MGGRSYVCVHARPCVRIFVIDFAGVNTRRKENPFCFLFYLLFNLK